MSVSIAAVLFLGALVPASAQPTAEPAPAFVSILDGPPTAPLPPTLPQQIATKGVQLVGGWGSGIVVGIAGAGAAIAPALIVLSADSGNVGVGVIALGGAVGYAAGASWAICTAGEELGGCKGSQRMTGLGVGAGLLFTVAFLETGVEGSRESLLLASFVPPLAGMLAFELSKTGSCVRKPVPPAPFILGGIVSAGVGVVALQRMHVAPRRAVIPLFQVRW